MSFSHSSSTPEPQVMGILNLTPDSFSDGGCFVRPEAALAQAQRMVEEGATYIDIGGESTRPGAAAVSVEEELQRVIPVLQAVRESLPSVKISVDTSKPEVMRAAITAGASMINDVKALREPGALQAVADSSVDICLMHMQGEPRTMQQHPVYQDVVAEVKTFLAERIQACEQAGIHKQRLYLDPGFGFGKTLSHNLLLMKHLKALHILDCPLLIGVSRKSMIGAVLDKPVDQRLYGGLALAVLAVQQGAAIIRTHDVAPTYDVLKMMQAVEQVAV